MKGRSRGDPALPYGVAPLGAEVSAGVSSRAAPQGAWPPVKPQWRQQALPWWGGQDGAL